MRDSESGEWLTTAGAAEYAGALSGRKCLVVTIRKNIERGNIGAERFGRQWKIARTEIERWVIARRPAGNPRFGRREG